MVMRLMTRSLIILAGVLLCDVSFYGSYQWVYELPYQRFLAEEEKVKPLYAQLNEDVLAQLPPPSNVELVRTLHGCNHGDCLVATYDPKGMSEPEILAYYYQLLLSGEWKAGDGFENVYQLYRRDSSCIKISIMAEDEQYSVVIWHDFRAQSFSPQLPAQWILDFHELDQRLPECP